MAKRLPRFPIPSEKCSETLRGGSLVYFHKPNLGDKLQALAVLSPLHVRAFELLVDQTLRDLKRKPRQKKGQ